MPLRFSANLSFLFTEAAWPERIDAAAGAGFAAIEVNPPHPYDGTPEAFARRLRACDLACPLLVAPLGTGASAYGHACVPGEEAGFRDSILRAIDYAAACGCPLVHPSAGLIPVGQSPYRVAATYVANIAWAAEAVAAAGLRLVVEPVCAFRTPGFFLRTTAQALNLIARSGRDDIGLIFDVFHVEKEEGDAVGRLAAVVDRVAHVQVSDTPNRQPPGAGAIDFPAVFALLERRGYAGWVGCEYIPDPGPLDLGWMPRPAEVTCVKEPVQ